MDYMATLPDKAFELAIVDPPYGIGADKENLSMTKGLRVDGSKRKDKTWKSRDYTQPKYKEKNWDNAKPTQEYFDELFRVSKNQIIWGGNYFPLPLVGGWIVWDKEKPENFSLSKGELAWTSCNNSLNIFRWLWAGYAKKEPEERIHSTQKPVALYKWLLSRYAKPGDKILDTHGGSGSICIACHDLGYDLTWMELDKDYYDSACKRYKLHASQASLFEPEEIRQEVQPCLL
jgi:site-specific DNA-methyltransferase (adenine-specific)